MNRIFVFLFMLLINRPDAQAHEWSISGALHWNTPRMVGVSSLTTPGLTVSGFIRFPIGGIFGLMTGVSMAYRVSQNPSISFYIPSTVSSPLSGSNYFTQFEVYSPWSDIPLLLTMSFEKRMMIGVGVYGSLKWAGVITGANDDIGLNWSWNPFDFGLYGLARAYLNPSASGVKFFIEGKFAYGLINLSRSSYYQARTSTPSVALGFAF